MGRLFDYFCRIQLLLSGEIGDEFAEEQFAYNYSTDFILLDLHRIIWGK